MDDRKDVLKDSLQDRGAGFRMPVDDALWEKIADGLPRQKSPVVKRLQIAGLAAAVLLVALFVGRWLIVSDETPVDQQAATPYSPDFIEKSEQPQLIVNAPQTTETKKPIQRSANKGKHQPEIKRSEGLTSTPATGDLLTREEHAPSQSEPQSEPQSQQAQKQKEQESGSQTQEERKRLKEEFISAGQSQDLWVEKTPGKKTGKKIRNLSFALALGNQASSFSPAPSLAPTEDVVLPRYSLHGAEHSPNTIVLSEAYSTSQKLKDGGEGVDTQPSASEYDYKTPVTLSFLVRKNLSDRWALESGIAYTRLQSAESFSNSGISRDIELDYLGVPLKAVYSIYQNDRLSVYAAAGGMLEKSIRGREILFSPEKQEGNKQSLKVSEPQWSVMSNVGVNFRLVRHFGLFAEPGLQYYFDDGSPVRTIRKDKPLNVSVQAGVRLIY